MACHPEVPPGADSAGRQAPLLEKEPVAPNDFCSVLRRSYAVAGGPNLLECGLVCFPIHDFCRDPPRIFCRSSAVRVKGELSNL